MKSNALTLRFIIGFIIMYEIELNLCEEFCYSERCDRENERYLFYDVNPSEGFNLRRDVYMRFAMLVRRLRQSKNDSLKTVKLVLPPWSHLIHWQRNELPEHIPWATFFDLESLNLFVPVIEMNDFFALQPKYYKAQLDDVYILQHFADMFETGNFEERMEVQKCQRHRDPLYWYYDNITSSNVKCLSFHGPATHLTKLLSESSANTIMFDHAEVALHDRFGDKEYWMARRSMRFSKSLVTLAENFREKFLNSSDIIDNTALPDNWLYEAPKRNALGGPYLAIHLRRRDFASGRPQQIPSLVDVAEQSNTVLEKLKLKYLFIATDALEKEYKYLTSLIKTDNIFRYIPSEDVQQKYKDGGVAIVDQIICSHARYFIGTQDSTFSFRIYEEREILGLPVETTFNSFCRSGSRCEKPSVWKIEY